MKTKQQQAIELWDTGQYSQTEISKMVDAPLATVWCWVNKHLNPTQGELDRRRHEAFFNGMTPAEEYRQHAQRRLDINDKLEGECV